MVKNVITNKMETPEKQDCLRVMLALSNDDAPVSGPCPDPNDMAAFVDGTIKRKKSKEIAAHLNSCHDCYNDWLIVSAAMAEPKKSSIINDLKSTINELKLVITDVMDRFFIPKPVFKYGLAVAVAACLIITFWTVNGSNLGDLINNSYSTNIVAGISQDDLEFNNIYKLPWERSITSYGFAPQPTDSDTSRAFGAGLWSARQEVIGDQKSATKPDFVKEELAWQKSPKEIDYWLGRWSYLLRAVCLSDEEISQDFWGKQLKILKKTQKVYSESHIKDNESLKMVTIRLDNIKSILTKSDKGTLTRENRREIAAELDFLINSLSPRYSEKG
jgi:hypothetical protein